MRRWFWRWGPAMVVATLIFAASATPAVDLPHFGAWDWVFKKSGHALGYAALSLTLLHGLANGRSVTWRQRGLAVGLAAVYASTDEFHQVFVAGRGASPIDVGIDTLGALLGMLLSHLSNWP